MEATAMNNLLQQLHKVVPSFNVASIPRDATGYYASPVHIIAGLIDVTPVYIQKIINHERSVEYMMKLETTFRKLKLEKLNKV